MKELFAPHLGRPVRLGRKRPVAPTPRPKLARYLAGHAVPVTPPAACDYSAKASPVLLDVMGNDELGDCVIAGAYHLVGVWTGNAGPLFHATRKQILADYSAIGGYVPGDPSTDQGCDEDVAINYWRTRGFADGTKLAGGIHVDPTNRLEVQAALYLFENLFFGFELPDAWVDPFPVAAGFVWDMEGPPVPENGHCVVGVGYNAEGVIISTWGMLGIITWAALAKYGAASAGGAAYALLSPDQVLKGAARAPNGFAWEDLIRDFDALGGTVPVPAPTPEPPSPEPPAPGPVPPPPAVTLDMAQEWVRTALAHANPLLTRAHAEKVALHALAAHWPKL